MGYKVLVFFEMKALDHDWSPYIEWFPIFVLMSRGPSFCISPAQSKEHQAQDASLVIKTFHVENYRRFFLSL